jgi:hypothetical protein
MSNVFDRMVSQNGGAPDAIVPIEEVFDSQASGHASEADELARTAPDVKKVTQELLRHGYLEEAQKRELFRLTILYEHAIQIALEPLDLELRLDKYRGIAFLGVVASECIPPEEDGAWSHPLVKRQRLTLEQSLLVAMLRQAFVIHEQELGVGGSTAKIAVDELLPQFMTYFGDSGSDAKNESRLLTLLDQLKPYGIVSEVDKKHEVTIRPLIAHLATPESLTDLLSSFKTISQPSDETGHED